MRFCALQKPDKPSASPAWVSCSWNCCWLVLYRLKRRSIVYYYEMSSEALYRVSFWEVLWRNSKVTKQRNYLLSVKVFQTDFLGSSLKTRQRWRSLFAQHLNSCIWFLSQPISHLVSSYSTSEKNFGKESWKMDSQEVGFKAFLSVSLYCPVLFIQC